MYAFIYNKQQFIRNKKCQEISTHNEGEEEREFKGAGRCCTSAGGYKLMAEVLRFTFCLFSLQRNFLHETFSYSRVTSCYSVC
jgi:hypothetical protein